MCLLAGLANCDESELDESSKNQEDLIQDELKLMNEELANRTSSDEPQEVNQEDEEDALDTTITSSTPSSMLIATTSEAVSTGVTSKSGGRTNRITSLVRVQLKKEIRKLKSSMTDSIMEEVINYYGKKLDSVDGFKEELNSLSRKFESLSQSMNSLTQNFKSISRNHRNLVDVVRNNLLNKNEDKVGSKGRKNSADLVNVLKKKSADNRTLIQDGVADNLESLKDKIKVELLKELETKYATFKIKTDLPSIEGTEAPIDSVLATTTAIHSSTQRSVTSLEYSISNKNKKSPTGKFN